VTASQSAPAAEGAVASPARPVRFADPVRNAAYWARIDRVVAVAPPLSNEQKAVIRAAFHQPAAREAA